jgi:hypothetical protein
MSRKGVRQGAVVPGPERKNPVDLDFVTLRNYWYEGGACLNWVFPIDIEPFKETKMERMGLRDYRSM